MKTLDKMVWKEHLYLPTGWLHKERKETDKCINIISKEGKMFNSYKVAVLFMRSTSNYSSEDIHTFYLFPDGDKKKAEKRRGKMAMELIRKRSRRRFFLLIKIGLRMMRQFLEDGKQKSLIQLEKNASSLEIIKLLCLLGEVQ